jgi:hypothetical protein
LSDQSDLPNDEYTGIFDEATVGDFLRESSARDRWSRTNSFDTFVDEQIRAIRTAWIAAETYMQPVALIANDHDQSLFIPDDDETLREFIDRVHREAKAMGATWTFVAKRTMVASFGSEGAEDFDLPVDDAEAWEKAVAQGLATLGVVWYAEHRDDRVHQRRHGQLQEENGVLGRLREGAPNQSIPLFAEILDN